MSIDVRTTRAGERRYDVRLRRPDGSVYSRTFRTRRDAEAFEHADRAARDRGTWTDPRGATTTLGEYADRWLATRTVRGRPLAPRSLENYRYLLDRYIRPQLGAVALGRLTGAAVRTWHADLVRDTPASVPPKAYRLLHAVLATAVNDDLIAANPCRIVGASSERTAERPSLGVADIARLADAIEPHWRAMVLLAAYGSLRFGELIGLRRRDVDLLHGVVLVEGQLVELAGGRQLRTGPKSAAGRRHVALPPFVTRELERHLVAYVAASPDSLVFTGERGGSPTRTNWARTWARARDAAGLPAGIHLHDLRHAGATMSAQVGATTRELMVRLGHASPRAALLYQHAAEGRDRALADALEQLVATEMTVAAANSTTEDTELAHEPTRDGRAMDPEDPPDDAPPSTRRTRPDQPQQRVETMGIEPTTPCLQSRCSAN